MFYLYSIFVNTYFPLICRRNSTEFSAIALKMIFALHYQLLIFQNYFNTCNVVTHFAEIFDLSYYE